jgi:3-oxo-5-alpha-steroid 4-dehydrogenase 1
VFRDAALHAAVVDALFIAAAVSVLAVTFITAPYGRHEREGWGPRIPSRLGWVLMESPAVLAYVAFYLQGERRFDLVPLVLLAMWQSHYVFRAFVFPLRMRVTGKRMPVLVPLLAIIFNLANAWANALWISHFGHYEVSWLWDPRFVIGAALFFGGMYINRRSDRILLDLRAPGETGYKIPRGGLYRWVSSPNYFGELLEWLGWAVATWSLAGLSFFVYTAANLGPRAASNHRWYRERFGAEYPAERRALIPYVW